MIENTTQSRRRSRANAETVTEIITAHTSRREDRTQPLIDYGKGKRAAVLKDEKKARDIGTQVEVARERQRRVDRTA